jgi:hypothetical protein
MLLVTKENDRDHPFSDAANMARAAWCADVENRTTRVDDARQGEK